MKKETVRFGGKTATPIKGTLIGISVTLAVMLLLAGIMTILDTDRAYAAPFATVSLGAGCFFASFYVAKKRGNRGYIIGLAVGCAVFVAVTAVSLAVCKSGVTLNTLFHLIIVILASVAGGIAGVNKNRDKKYI